MFTSLSIKNFRGFRDLEIGPLERVNLIAGANNVGKTALLEAMFLLLGETNLELVARITAFRGLRDFKGSPEDVADAMWTPLFRHFDVNTTIEIEGQRDDGASAIIQLRLVPAPSIEVPLAAEPECPSGYTAPGVSSKALEIIYEDGSGTPRKSTMQFDQEGRPQIRLPSAPPSFPGYFLATKFRNLETDANILGDLHVQKDPYATDLLEMLRPLEPRLRELRTISKPSGPLIYGDIELPRMLPLPLMGEGMVQLTSILLRMTSARSGVVLIDEMENGFHYSVLQRVWKAVGEAARRFDVQVFATTHSWECIRAAHEAFSVSGTYDLRLHRLDRLNGEIRAVTYDQESLATSVEMSLEVR